MSAHSSTAGQVVERARRIQVLSRVGVFQLLSPLLLDEVAKLLAPRAVSAGETVIVEGTLGDALYLVELGTLAVLSGQHTVARLGPGEFFGEIALLTGGATVASVRAETQGELWVLPAEEFHRLVANHPGLSGALRRAGALRQQELTAREYDIERTNLAAVLDRQHQVTIGRAADNDIVLDSRVVSGHHAVVRRFGDTLMLEDLGSSNGTYVNGAEVRRAELKDGDHVWIADQRLLFDRRDVARIVEPKGIRIDATGLHKVVKGGKDLLQDISLTVLPGEFVAIVGGSGAGKSTLMDALSGVRPASGGEVRYNGEEFYSRRALYTPSLGYVPQDDIIHRELPLRLTLDYAARLRLPPDTSRAERRAVVDKAVAQLGLTEQRDIAVERLSGGQRKRASIGVELLTEPRVFFLDEPTSGLDPAADTAMMRLMRELASTGSTVVLTTHATKNVVLCDKVVFLAKGGHLAYMGTPAGALQYFGTTEFDAIYDLLATETPAAWGARFRATPEYQRLVSGQGEGASRAAGAGATPTRRRGGLLRQVRQFAVLTSRTLQTYVKSPPAFMPLLVPPLVLPLMTLAVTNRDTFEEPLAAPADAIPLLFLMVFLGFLYGMLYGVQVIARESAIFRRERLVGQGVLPYVLSKVAVLAPVLLFASAALLLLLWLFDRLADAPLIGFYLPLYVSAVLLALCGLAISLLLSALVRTPTQATDLLSLLILPQVLFGGGLTPVSAMNDAGVALSRATFFRPGFEAAGDSVGFLERLANSSHPIAPVLLETYEGFFTSYTQNWLIMAAWIVAPLAVACVVLKLKTRVR